MPLTVYNTLTRKKEPFETVEDGKVRMYLCGPTVYKPAHIGHLVGPTIFDTVKRYLTYRGYDVTFVVNITDVDDKLIAKAAETGRTVEDVAGEMTEDYFDNLRLMGVDSIDQFPKATDHVGDMLAMIERLVEKDAAYPLNGDVYFAVGSDEDYGKLSGRDPEEMLAGTRAETAADKQHPADFALWKGSKPGEPAWDSPWGPGRPGWHIECSAMAGKILGEEIDIHGGGLDLMFPHHENELAQSETCHGRPFARYWMHNGLMQAGTGSKLGGAHSREGDTNATTPASELTAEEQVAGKLAGSAGAESVKTAVFAHQPPEAVRAFLLSTHYRSPIDFRLENIENTRKSLEGFYRLFESYQRATGDSFYKLTPAATAESTVELSGEPAEFLSDLAHQRDRFREAMDDDFNTGGAMGVLFDLRRLLNGFIAQAAADESKRSTLTKGMLLLRELSTLLGLFREPPQVAGNDDAFTGRLMELVLELRQDMRAEKNWAAADKIRDALNELDVVIEDSPDGARWSRK